MQFLLETRSKFQKYDIDKSNTIDLSELKQLLEMLHFDSDIVGSLMKLFDTKSKVRRAALFLISAS
jgi:Ca2+-binding EF-hand superfamily protein